MTAQIGVAAMLAPYEPQMPIDRLVVELNKLYHKYEAATYNDNHPEISIQLPAIWQQMLRTAADGLGSQRLRVLDFGCGTGFEAKQLLASVSAGQVAELVCYDLSPEMLDCCRERLANSPVSIRWTHRLEDIFDTAQPYNLVLTNSLLHHLPDPIATVHSWLPVLAADAFWLAGHEPSSRFYMNESCRSLYQEFLRSRSWNKYFSAAPYIRRVRSMLRPGHDPARKTALEAKRQGLFRRRPPTALVSRMVDFHVAHSGDEARAGRGFDFELLAKSLGDDWELRRIDSYSFMGPFYERQLPKRWSRECHTLEKHYPRDGANFCSMWRRVSTEESGRGK